MSEWQDIRTAPKDGSEFEASPAYDDYSATARWSTEYGDGIWYMVGVGHLNGLWRPMIWRPLPSKHHQANDDIGE